jgi:hypothetical protein
MLAYITDEPTIYHTRGEHATHYTTDEPTIYHTRGEHATHYTTDELCRKVLLNIFLRCCFQNRGFIGGVMGSVLASSVVDRGSSVV